MKGLANSNLNALFDIVLLLVLFLLNVVKFFVILCCMHLACSSMDTIDYAFDI